MDRLAFNYGAYSARSVIASAQRCVNYFPEINPADSAFPLTLYQRPGLRSRAQAEYAPWRMLHQASNGNGYGICGPSLYYIGPDWSLTKLGSVTPGRVNPCSMSDNGTDALVVDGSPNGWTFKIADNSGFQQIVDPTGFFQGADRCDVLDTYLLWNIIGTRQFGSTLSGRLEFDALYFGAKSAYPDPLQSLIVNRREILLPGLVKSELWYDAGNTNLPFAELPGAYVEHGLAAKYTLASNDISVFWLGRDLQNGVTYVLRQRGYETRVISNPAVSYAIRKMLAAGYDITQTIGWCYSQDGHTFYVLQFPQQGTAQAPIGDQTWVFDDSIDDPMKAWHQEAWTDADGLLHRHRGNCYAALYGQNICGDWTNGQLYSMDPDYYYDQVDAGAGAGIVTGGISFIRGFPHAMAGRDVRTGQLVPANGRLVTHHAFWAAMETGNTPVQDIAAQLTLRYSNDWGKSWVAAPLFSAGAAGEYGVVPQQGTLGTARFRLYELSHSIAGEAALMGAWVDGRLSEANR